MQYEWIDTHTHLEHEYPFSTDEYLDNARGQGVTAFVTIGTTPETLHKLRDYAVKYPDVYFTVGIHPHDTKDFNDAVEKEMDELRQHPKCVGVGEIGLDYHYDHSPRDIQHKALIKQLELAVRWDKPVIIHARDAEAELLEAFKNYVGQCSAERRTRPGIIHCFSGTRHFAEECLKLGFYLSFSGIVTFKKAADLREIVRDVPLDRILLETDAPFLAPVPHRGKPNQSAYLIETAKIVASSKDITLESLSSATVANSKRIFDLKNL